MVHCITDTILFGLLFACHIFVVKALGLIPSFQYQIMNSALVLVTLVYSICSVSFKGLFAILGESSTLLLI